MLIRTPALDSEQIEKWIRDGTETIGPANGDGIHHGSVPDPQWHDSFDFKKARQALQRARSKTAVRTIKPLRRIRTNQAAVNESLIDAISALAAVNKAMAQDLAALGPEIAELRARLANRRPPNPS